MHDSLRNIRIVLGGLIIAAVGVIYLQNFPPPGTPGWANCLLLWMLLSLLVLLFYVGCIYGCGTNPDEPLDPKCQARCERFLWWAEGVLTLLLFGCIAGSHWF